ncbi:MAG: adenosylmethionine decarboxylase [Clostridiales bacterium]|nr:adenosylmethionine decarboxylase [Clostridiales bacterium]
MVEQSQKKIQLYGFNNLTKTLSFNIYDICYTKSEEDRRSYINYIDEQYNSERLTNILKEVTNIIGASILNIAKQDYDPQGASVTILISEEEVPLAVLDSSCNSGSLPLPRHVVGHLDKSHITVHTYPESHPHGGISTFRVDIDVSTCGTISPLRALNLLIKSFDSDIITVDYRVRGFTRDTEGNKYFIDHDINSIQDFVEDDILDNYSTIDVNVFQENIFHTKMMRTEVEFDEYLFNLNKQDLSEEETDEITDKVYKEIEEIFYGKNF